MKKKLFLITVALIIFNALTFAQQTTVKGTVTADDGSALPGATVVVKGTSAGTVTDMDGNYTINTESTDAVLVFSFIGYNTEEVTVNGQATINISLLPDISDLDEVVVVGYGVQKKSLVTGAISQVKSEDIEKSTVTRIEQAIQGKAPGVYVAQNSGEPGGGMSIKIRGTSSDGNNEPIYIVDGIRTGGLEYVNPSDIESMEILKDAASCAIYGAEGGNGVVLITTKKGKKGEGRVDYKYSYGLQSIVNSPNVMDAQQYKDYFMEATRYENNKDSALFMDLSTDNGTNWLDEVFQVAPMHDHQLSFSGGSEKTTYYFSTGFLDQDGIVGGEKTTLPDIHSVRMLNLKLKIG